jgi:HD-like signal output (HDOD) protein
MDISSKRPPPQTLRRFHPLKHLNEIQLELLANSLRILYAPAGKKLLERGDSSPYSLYLLKGRLRLTSNDGRITDISDQSSQASNPIAHLIPRRYEVSALCPVEYMLIDNPLLEGVLSDHTDGYTATEINLVEDDPEHRISEAQLSKALQDDLENDCLVLPSLPDIAVRVGREMNEENTNANRLASIIHTDPVITAKLIRAANSPLYGGINPVETCSAAVIRLGTNTTHNLVLTFALRELFITRSAVLKQHMRKLWEHSVKVSVISYALAKLTGRFDPEHALLAGLLHDIGVVAILDYCKRFADILQDEGRLDRVIQNLRSVTSARILQTWGFIEELVEVAEQAENWFRDKEGPADYADLVIVAQLHGFIGSTKMRELPTLDQVPAFKRLELGELTPQKTAKVLETADDMLDRLRAMLKSS